MLSQLNIIVALKHYSKLRVLTFCNNDYKTLKN